MKVFLGLVNALHVILQVVSVLVVEDQSHHCVRRAYGRSVCS